MLFKKKKKKKTLKAQLRVPKTVQETIPYLRIYEDTKTSGGIIEIKEGVFTKSYLLDDVNFTIAAQEEQEAIFQAYEQLLNIFGSSVKAEITINNRNIDPEQFNQNTLLNYNRDALDVYREEYNEMLLEKIQEGKNNIKHEKYLTVTIEAEGIEQAVNSFQRIDREVGSAVKRITGLEPKILNLDERMEILHDIYNLGHEGEFLNKTMVDGHLVKTFDLNWIKRTGITTKDLVAPPSFLFKEMDSMMVGNKYAQALYIQELPSYLNTDFLSELSDLACNMLVSAHFYAPPQEKSLKYLTNQMTNINADIVKAQKNASKAGYSPDLISPSLMKAKEEAEKLLQDVTSRNQKLFQTTLVITHFADSKEELERDKEEIMTVGHKYMCQIKTLNFQQETGLNSSLPLGNNMLSVTRTLTTESSAVYIPFSAQELVQDRGMYYGLNAVSKNMLLFNRKNSKNANGIILGTPGSGKSFAAKREIVNILLNTEDHVYIIDPEREYAALAMLLDGEVIRIAPGSNTHINPLDMDVKYADDDNPVTLKSDFIISLCEAIIGSRYSLSPVQKSVIDRCVRRVYHSYMEELSRSGKTIDTELAPTLKDFYNDLLAQPEADARNIALALEMYCTGSLDTFAYHSNVKTNKRFVVYDIKDIGTTMKEVGLHVCLDAIWNRLMTNKRKGLYTWFYIDEFYLLTQTENSARFLQQVWKRARKWGGIPTGITQNVDDLLRSPESVVILNNCDFIMMLNQAPLDRAKLAELLNISNTQLSYITNSDSGQGLIYTGKSIIPFIDRFPQHTKLYEVMTTKPEDVNLKKQAG